MEIQVIKARKSDLGDGFIVRRSLPYSKKRMVGPFIFWDHMGPVQVAKDFEMKVRAHPHIGLATLTYLFSGEIMHRDNLGYKQPIRPGEVNWMTAGRGIAHSERANSEQEYDHIEGIQLWIALPKDKELVEPSFQHVGREKLPIITCGEQSLTLIAGEYAGQKSPVNTYSPLFYLHGEPKAGHKIHIDLPESWEGALYLTEGQITVAGNTYSTGELLVFPQSAKIEATVESDANMMVFGGEPFPEKRFIWWNFVSSDEQLIEKAKEDWKAGRFAPVTDENEIIPLPEK